MVYAMYTSRGSNFLYPSLKPRILPNMFLKDLVEVLIDLHIERDWMKFGLYIL